MAGITCGDVTGKDGAWTRRLVRGGGGDSAVRSERSRLRLRRAFRLVSNSKAGVGSMVEDVTSGIRGWEGSGCESRGVAASITHRRTSTAVADVGPIITVGKRVSGAF